MDLHKNKQIFFQNGVSLFVKDEGFQSCSGELSTISRWDSHMDVTGDGDMHPGQGERSMSAFIHPGTFFRTHSPCASAQP